MNKKQSIIVLIIVGILMITLALFIIPLNGEDSFEAGDSNYDVYWVSKAISMGLDLKGGMYAEYSGRLQDGSEPSDADIEGAIANLEELLYSKGYSEATVTKIGNTQVRVEVPQIEDTSALMKLIGKSATLEFKDADGTVLITGEEHLKDCFASMSDSEYVIKLEFNDAGAQAFADATEANLNKTIDIYIDGEKVMSPTVNSVISDGNAIIEGNYTYDTANDMAVRLKAGISSVKLSLLRSETISPTLGDEALSKAILAAIIGVAFIMVFMMLIYRGLGLASTLALTCYIELLLFFLAVVPWVQLTLTGIAGVILSIGMAVDGNVVIFEQIKEERLIGNRLVPSAIKTGFSKTLVTILDANVTTILGAIVMLIVGSSAIKSFALTLLIGIILSLISSILITRMFVNCFLGLNDENEAFYGLSLKGVSIDE
ncbi:MAG: protein translocase subunit SecD [Clostridia bacterium]